MKKNYFYIAVLVFNCFLCAFSQVLLKKAAQKEWGSFIRQYLNAYVVLGYSLFFVVLAVNVWILRYVPVNIANPVCESLPLVISFFTGMFFFGEKLTKFKVLGALAIVAGILVVIV
ncbi:MAG: EamA family transporter [Treponema sp.]|nr:EamA family transporter [Treponema sp.]